ncbi:MAG: sorbosone dehydrogenase [Caulobacteraceae bacterium]|nr:sorbosone dehydrogenase [Caulobacteraceae bacterium]
MRSLDTASIGRLPRSAGALACTSFLAACAVGPVLPPEAGVGPQPQLPAPHKQIIPTVKIATATGWPRGAAPTPAPGLALTAFARGLTHPRWLYVLPNGDVLVAETNGPGEPAKGIRDLVMKQVMKRAGAGVPSPERISLLRDADGDGVAETRTVFLEGLHSPFGMTLVGDRLYVANTDAVVSFPYRTGDTRITGPATKLVDLPGGPIDHHWTKNIIASPDGARLYVTVGSNSNVGENGLAAEAGRASIWEIDRASGKSREFATGLRNPNGMDWQPQTGALWTVVNERDEIGNDLVPDYLTSVKDGGFYGWPYSYYGQNVDVRVSPQRPDLVGRATVPDYALGSHTASLGMTFSRGGRFPAAFADGAFVGQHGSWNRAQFNGYKVIFVPFVGGKPAGLPVEVLTGFVDKDGHARGRPVGVAIDRRGGLLVADDVGDAVWRVSGR